MRKAKGGNRGQDEQEPKIHNRLKVLRVERGMSRQELAEGLGINYQTVGYIERGDYNPSLELVFRISELFGLPIEAVFSREPFRPLSEEVYGREAAGEGADAVNPLDAKTRGGAR
jgi:DNA-binding XRE family transcriptional regulator